MSKECQTGVGRDFRAGGVFEDGVGTGDKLVTRSEGAAFDGLARADSEAGWVAVSLVAGFGWIAEIVESSAPQPARPCVHPYSAHSHSWFCELACSLVPSGVRLRQWLSCGSCRRFLLVSMQPSASKVCAEILRVCSRTSMLLAVSKMIIRGWRRPLAILVTRIHAATARRKGDLILSRDSAQKGDAHNNGAPKHLDRFITR